MKLSRVERLILSNQYRILEAFYPEEADGLTRHRDALESGYELHYGWLAEHIYDGADVMTEAECREVINILELFSVLKRSSALVADDPTIASWQIEFAGFDGNNEVKQLGYARYFCGLNGGRFTDLDRGDDFNSHMPSLARYQRQLGVWRECGDKHHLSREDVVRIAAAAKYPE